MKNIHTFVRKHFLLIAPLVIIIGVTVNGVVALQIYQAVSNGAYQPATKGGQLASDTRGDSGAGAASGGGATKAGSSSSAKTTPSPSKATTPGTTTKTATTTTELPVTLPPAPSTPFCANAAYGVGCHPWIGAATYDSTSGSHLSWASFQSQAQGKLQARRSYLDPSTTIPSSFASSAAGPDIANNDVTFFSMKLDPGAFSSGTLDSQFNNFLNSIPSGHQTYLTYWHEPEDDIASGTVAGGTALTLANWKASVNHMGQLIHATHRSELHNMIILQGPWTFYSGGYGNTDYWDAGFDANLDSLGLDIYASGVTSGGYTNYASIPSKFGYSGMMSFLSTHFTSRGKQWGIPEIGAHEQYPSGSSAATIASMDQQKAQWIADSWAWAKANHAIAYLYFDYNATSGLPDSQSNIIAAGSPAEALFRQIAAEANK